MKPPVHGKPASGHKKPVTTVIKQHHDGGSDNGAGDMEAATAEQMQIMGVTAPGSLADMDAFLQASAIAQQRAETEVAEDTSTQQSDDADDDGYDTVEVVTQKRWDKLQTRAHEIKNLLDPRYQALHHIHMSMEDQKKLQEELKTTQKTLDTDPQFAHLRTQGKVNEQEASSNPPTIKSAYLGTLVATENTVNPAPKPDKPAPRPAPKNQPMVTG